MTSVPAMLSAVRHRPVLWRRVVILPLMLAGAGVALLAPAVDARAQDAHGAAPGADPVPSAAPGFLIVRRDVPVRHAMVAGEPAAPDIVRTDGASELFGALALGLAPITDGEAGAVTAGIRPSIDQAGVLVDGAMRRVDGIVGPALAGAGAGPGDAPGGAAGTIGGVVDDAMGSIGATVGGVMGAIPTAPDAPGAGGGR